MLTLASVGQALPTATQELRGGVEFGSSEMGQEGTRAQWISAPFKRLLSFTWE